MESKTDARLRVSMLQSKEMNSTAQYSFWTLDWSWHDTCYVLLILVAPPIEMSCKTECMHVAIAGFFTPKWIYMVWTERSSTKGSGDVCSAMYTWGSIFRRERETKNSDHPIRNLVHVTCMLHAYFIVRRAYSVNALWHIDGNHHLIRYVHWNLLLYLIIFRLQRKMLIDFCTTSASPFSNNPTTTLTVPNLLFQPRLKPWY